MSMLTVKQALGCWLHERWRAEVVLQAPRLASVCGLTWQGLHNRDEVVLSCPGMIGRVCDWADSSSLTVARVFPRVGKRLLKHCLKEWPIVLAEGASGGTAMGSQDAPVVSFIVPVGGADRKLQFKVCIQSLLAQRGISFELVVVEHGVVPEYEDLIPCGVKYIFLPAQRDRFEFNKAFAMNRGVAASSGKYLALHDSDMLAPVGYASSIAGFLGSGWDAVRPARFIFHLDQKASEAVQNGRDVAGATNVHTVVQNNPTPVCLSRDAYDRVGGHDESFTGWGGEDLEFLDRLQTTRISHYGYLPLVHLWHLPAAKKQSGDRNSEKLNLYRAIQASERILRLRSQFGSNHEIRSESLTAPSDP